MSNPTPTQKPWLTTADIKLLEQKFATKDDLKRFATKEDLKGFATKDDLIGLAHITEVEAIFEKHQALTDKKLDKIITILDSVVGELQTIRQEQTVTGHQLQDHEDRLTVLESAISIQN